MADDNGSDSNEGLANSPYRSPTASVGGVVGDGSGDIMLAFLGPKNTAFYKQVFGGFEARGGAMSWNWPAFLVTWFWLAYRKMWAWFFIYWLVWPFVVMVVALIAGFAHPALAISVYVAGYLVVPPLFANRLYYRHARKKISKAQFVATDERSQALEAARLGGTSNIVVVIVPVFIALIGILAAIAIPAYQDYTIRAQVSQGMVLSAGAKAAVENYYVEYAEMPGDNATAGLAAAENISGNFVSSVTVDNGVITVTYGNEAHSLIADHSLELQPNGSGGAVAWECSSSTIAPGHLPAACR